jgi:antitoxin component YwqK of YwqJK toxin-antitoxin module
MKKAIFLLAIIISVKTSVAQFKGQIPEEKRYDAAKVIDPDYGIKMYDKLNFQIGGDSVRNTKKGYACQGWVEDYYTTGEVIHKGYYEDGHLTLYKNFFPNGNVERSFSVSGYKRSSLQIFYSDAKIKSTVTFYENSPQFWTDYYQNGQVEYTEENSKDMEYLIYRRSYAQDGKPQELFELVNPKKRIYSKKEYYENGNIKAEGSMIFNPSLYDYQKDGAWIEYDEKGKPTKEKWVKGEQIKES